ncbi:DUF3291 domain-containing protein [Fibrella sp. HMF5335]|uniref:DUF3291 domain-containing protein n=1 Tax=Fibrella rubiginis TaxID=2817060 RepID=A0A939K4F1_9BACT|nr:DUF3291 domain-containing protein [Fibrella rubiginis]MBO0936638.1 DUF3291 domain-containing protein [Fibrella rubiginis]
MPLVTLTILKFAPGDRYRAFANMGRWLMKPFDEVGLRFQKMMGTGKNFGFIPDFSQYVFLGVWQDEASANAFFTSERWQPFLPKDTHGISTLYLQPFKSHGLWDGVNPFTPDKALPPPDPAAPVAVLTRANIRPGALLDFYRNIPQARQRIADQGDNLLLAMGVGEKPLVQQCTISVWKNAALVDQFAYRQSGHREIVKKTRDSKWYSEELFARFSVLRMEGEISLRFKV